MSLRHSLFLSCLALIVLTGSGRGEEVRIDIPGPSGTYTVERWKRDWPGCEWQDGVKEGNLSVVERDGGFRLRVDYRVGEIGPEKNGAGWRFPIARRDTAELRYTVRFGKEFDWVKGGKLPGLCGGPSNVSGGRPADGTNGFSARLMWRKEGRGEAYLYHKNQPERYGDQIDFPGDFRFPTGTDIRVRMRVTMNDPGKKNGAVQVWIRIGDGAEREVVKRDDLEWRSVDSFGIDAIYFETFHGGSDKSWAPSGPSHAEFGDFVVTP
ncbi:MAG: hypothetical protein JNJ70_19535 [Verrucomicrobiales bacterium]|nr:hypothetical protein [Verrucomicrobiales bacterium]